MLSNQKLIPLLKILTLLFIIAPNILFNIFWVKSSFGILSVIFILTGLYFYFRVDFNQKSDYKPFHFSFLNLIGLSFIALFLTLVSGTGGFSDQIYDYIGHNTKFRDLYEKPWPFRYQEVNSYPAYYFGYYLVPAFLAKMFNHVRILSMIWTSLGLFLVLFWAYILISKKNIVYLLIFLLFGGLYATGNHVFELITNKMTFADLYWSDFKPMSEAFLIYMPLYLSSVWVPNQFLPACMVIGFIVFEIFYEQKGYKSIALIPLLAIWAPFPALSIVFIVLGVFVFNTFKSNWQGIKLFEFLPAVIFSIGCLPIFLYLLSSKSGESANGFIWSFDKNWWLVWPTFLLLEFGLLTFLLLKFTKNSSKIPLEKSLLAVIITLCLLPVFHFGRNNDFTARACIPAFFLLNIILANRFEALIKLKSKLKFVVISLFLIGSFVPLRVFWRGTFHNKLFGEPKTYFVYGDMYQVLKNYHSPAEANQYLADNNSFFVKYLVKK